MPKWSVLAWLERIRGGGANRDNTQRIALLPPAYWNIPLAVSTHSQEQIIKSLISRPTNYKKHIGCYRYKTPHGPCIGSFTQLMIADDGMVISEPTQESTTYRRASSGGSIAAGLCNLRLANHSIADSAVLHGLHLAYNGDTTEFHA